MRPDDRFCGQCGRRIRIFCWSCGGLRADDQAPCATCGAAAPPSAEPAAVTAAPYEPQPISAFPVSPWQTPRPTSLEQADHEFGERRLATIAFSDLTGFTAMTESLDPETVDDVMASIKIRAHEIVTQHGGTLNQFVGDEIVALYGVPVTQGRDASAAVRATMMLHRMVVDLTKRQSAQLGMPLLLHSGICSGIVVVNQRDLRNGTYTVTGDTMNTAARLKAIAAAGEIILAPRTRKAVGEEFELEALTPILLKGKSEPLTPYRVTSIASSTSESRRWNISSTDFVNRKLELRALRDVVEHGTSRLVTAAVVGDVGVGKSRLLFEFLKTLSPERRIVWRGSGQAVATRTPYLPWIECLRAHLKIADDTPPDTAAAYVAAFCAANERLQPHSGPLLRLLGLPSLAAAPLPDDANGPELQRLFWDAIIAVLRDAASTAQTLVILDDWQYADGASRELHAEIARAMADEPLALITISTSMPTEPIETIVSVDNLELEPAIAMLRSIFSVTNVAADLSDAVYDRTVGNPLFIEEMAATMIEERSIIIEEIARLSVRPENLTLPANVYAAMLQRLDRLSPEQREVTRYAAVMGREFTAPVLQRLLPNHDVNEILRSLCASEIIMLIASASNRYIFTHGIMQEVAYETLLHRTRKRLHAAVGAVIEELAGDAVAERYEELAYHYARSADDERAIRYAELSGDKASDAYALTEARRHYQDAYTRLHQLDPASRDEARAGPIAIKWASVSVFAPTVEHMIALETSLKRATERGDDRMIAQIEYWIGRIDYAFGRYGNAIERFDRVSSLAQQIVDPDLDARATAVHGRVMLFAAEPKRGNELLERGIARLRATRNADEIAYSMSSWACLKALGGEHTDAEELYSRAMTIARNRNNRTIESLVLQQLGWGRALRGDWHRARETLDQCAALAERTGNQVLHAFADVFFAYTLSYDGSDIEARERMTRGIERYARIGAKLAASVVYGWAAEVFHRAGDARGAREAAEAAIYRGTDGDLFGKIAAQRALLSIAAAAGDLDGVHRLMNEIAEFATERRLLTDHALAVLAFADALARCGAPNADHAYADAARRFSEIEMPWFAALASTRAREVHGP